MRNLILILIIIIVKINASYTQPGSIDSTFGENGIFFLDDFQDYLLYHNEISIFDKKHRILIEKNEYDSICIITRYLPDGQPDGSFGINGNLDLNKYLPYPVKWSLLDDDKILIFNQNDDTLSIYRLNENGDPDTIFAKQGKMTIDLPEKCFIETILLQDDNKIVLGGGYSCEFLPASETTRCYIYLMRLDINGEIDSTFGESGTKIYYELNDSASKLFHLPDNNYLIVCKDSYGGFTHGPRDAFYLVRILNDGSMDKSFGLDGIVALTGFDGFPNYDVIVLKDQKILILAGFWNDKSIDQLTSEGKMDSTFSVQGKIQFDSSYSRIYDIKITDNGDFYVLGTVDWNDDMLLHFSKEGALDTTFGENGFAYLPHIGDWEIYGKIDMHPADKITVQGGYGENTKGRNIIVRLNNSEESDIKDLNYAQRLIHIFPNPSSDYFTVDIPSDINPEKAKMQVTDLYGRLILEKQGFEILTRHDVSGWSEGIYFVVIQEGKNIFRIKILVTR